MTLEQYINGLEELVKDIPEAANWQVVTSADDEGNSFNKVHFAPTIGVYEDGEFAADEEECNAVCVN